MDARCYIRDIPLELLLRIVDYLPSKLEFGNLRLASRDLSNALKDAFFKEYISQKYYTITESSLRTLVDISRSDYAGRVDTVQLCFEVEHIIQLLDVEMAEDGMGDPDVHSADENQAYHLICKQWEFVNGGAHIDLLTEAFRNLSQSLIIKFRPYNRSFYAVDGVLLEYAVYDTTRRDSGTHNSARRGRLDALNDQWSNARMFCAVLSALGRAGSRPKAIVCRLPDRLRLPNFAFAAASSHETTMGAVFADVEKLHLDLDPTEVNEGYCHVQRLLTQAPGLKDLRINTNLDVSLNVPDMAHRQGIPTLLQWIAEPVSQLHESPVQGGHPIPSPSLPSVPFANLGALSLGFMTISPPFLFSIVRKVAPTLKNLELWKMTLKASDNWTYHVRFTHDMIPVPPRDAWPQFLQRIMDLDDLDLQHILVGYPRAQGVGVMNFTTLYFMPENKKCKDYTGPSWRKYLEGVRMREPDPEASDMS